MTAQTSYARNIPVAYAGLIYAQDPHNIISRAVETGAGINFGVAVSRGTDKEKQTVLGGTDFLGITVRSLEREGTQGSGAILYKEKETAGIMRKGTIWAICPAGCIPGNPVKYTNATGILDAGAAAAGETQLDGAFWDSSASAGELGRIVLQTSDTTAGS